MYNTKQKTYLIEYLRNKKEPMSATAIASELTAIGKSTIFRLLASLEKEGVVQSCIENRTRLYIYKNLMCHNHIHIKPEIDSILLRWNVNRVNLGS